jgi:uncharacterized protein YdaU (DUF1376 family)
VAEERLAMLPWFPGDFMKSTRGWPLTARGVYRELLDAQWDMGRLPMAPEELRIMIGATEEEWAIAWPYVEAKFPGSKGRCRANVRLEIHRSKSQLLTAGKKKGAQITNLKRWGKDRSAIAQRDAQRSLPYPSPSPSPSPSQIRAVSETPDSASPPESASQAAPAGAADVPAKKRGSRISRPFFVTKAMRDWAKREAPTATDLDAITREFVDYWIAVPGQRGCKLDWVATWRNRVREVAGKSARSHQPRKTRFEELTEHLK